MRSIATQKHHICFGGRSWEDNEFILGHVLFQSEDVAEVQAEDDKAPNQGRNGEEQTYFGYTSEAGD